MADDQLIIGHRNSEWNGLGPILEEDIAFSSMAQDKMGQSEHLYNLLNQLGEADADTVAFTRNAPQFHCSHLVELPIGGYDFSLIRHFLFDFAEYMRFEADVNSWLQENLGKDQSDIQIQKKTNQLLSESEQMKLLVQIKLQAARNSKGPLFNQFKTSGTNLNASMGIGSDVL